MNINYFLKKILRKISLEIVSQAKDRQCMQFKSEMGYLDPSALIELPDVYTCPKKIFMYENTNIYSKAKFIMSPDGDNGRFIMMKNSGAAEGLTVITGNHHRAKGILLRKLTTERIGDLDKDVVVEEDVWIGANVTLMAGVRVGRGATIGTGAVCMKSVPPYAIVMGNPAKVIGFNFTPEEIIEHELNIYPENERLPLQKLETNYQKYFKNRTKEIIQLIKL